MPLSASWMDLEIVILSEVNKTEKEEDCMILLRCRIFRNRLRDLENELIVARGKW